jgi:hypothetical protein
MGDGEDYNAMILNPVDNAPISDAVAKSSGQIA